MSDEVDASLTISAELVAAFDALLVNRHDTYAVQQATGRYVRVQRPVDRELIRAHLVGRETLAFYALDRHGAGRWLCFDCDAPDGLATLAAIQRALADLGIPSLREASRRGGHLWVFCASLQPAPLLCGLGQGIVTILEAQEQFTPAAGKVEIYPAAVTPAADDGLRGGVGGVGLAVRAPFGLHKVTSQRYPFLASDGSALTRDPGEHLSDALTWLIAQPRVTSAQLRSALTGLDALLTTALDAAALALTMRGPVQARSNRRAHTPPGEAGEAAARQGTAQRQLVGRDRTHRALRPTTRRRDDLLPLDPVERDVGRNRVDVIAWVNRALALPDLIAEVTPEVELQRIGRGYGGWCPWHDDQAEQADGTPGRPSLYVVEDWTHGWSWRCYSTQCGAHQALMHDTFDWLIWRAGGDIQRAISWARARYEQLTGD